MKLKILAVFILSVSLFSCSQKTDTTTPGTPSMTAGTWRISYYWNTTDQTGSFVPYIFMFNSDGSMMGHTSTAMITGTWSETDTRLTINFTSDPVLSKINGNWLKTEKTSSSLKMKDDNPAQDDQLVFVKN